MPLAIGDVLKYISTDFPDNPPHPKIVLAITPDRKIIWVHTSRQRNTVEFFCKRYENKQDVKHCHTFVIATLAECPALDVESYINCNELHEEEEYVIIRDSAYEKMPSPASNELLAKIRVGILSSHRVEEKYRQMFIPPLSEDEKAKL